MENKFMVTRVQGDRDKLGDVKVKLLSRVRLCAIPWTAAHQAPPSMDFPGKSTGVGCHCLLRVSEQL